MKSRLETKGFGTIVGLDKRNDRDPGAEILVSKCARRGKIIIRCPDAGVVLEADPLPPVVPLGDDVAPAVRRHD